MSRDFELAETSLAKSRPSVPYVANLFKCLTHLVSALCYSANSELVRLGAGFYRPNAICVIESTGSQCTEQNTLKQYSSARFCALQEDRETEAH